MKVVLFCGGLGTRLREHSDTIPKPLVTVGYRPILWHLMRYYAHYGHKEFILCLGYRGDLIREFFLNYIRRMNSLRQRPEWYSAVTHNCTTSIRMQRAAADRAPWDWRMLANGHGDELLYERGMIPTNLPLAELKQRCHVNERARAADQAADFSRLIRQGVPGFDP